MAGPWFTVRESGSDWHTLDHIWLSDGKTNDRARVDIRIELEELEEQKETNDEI